MTWRVWGLGFRVQKVFKVHDCDLDQGVGFRV